MKIALKEYNNYICQNSFLPAYLCLAITEVVVKETDIKSYSIDSIRVDKERNTSKIIGEMEEKCK